MATLTGQTIAATYDALLKVTDNGPITSSLKLITDGLGNNTALSLSSSAASITGTLSVTSTIGASNLSGTNTGDETNATIKTKLGAASASQDGYLTSTDWSTFNNKVPASRTLTINGTSYDLSADRSWTIVAGVSSFNTRTGAITLTSLDVTDALGFTPVTNARTISTTAPLSGGGDLTANRTLSISQATTSTNGYLSSTDWNTFNNKQNALTNPVTGTGTTNYVAKFTGSTSIGNSLIYDNGTNVGIGIASPFGRFHSLSTGTGSNTISGVFSDGSTNGNAITISNATGLSTISATYLSTAIDSALAFQTTTGGVSSERMRIAASGSVGIGTTTLTGYNVNIAKNITGATTSYGINIGSSIQSDVTTAYIYRSAVGQAAGGTLTELTHFLTSGQTFSGTVTSQYGFNAGFGLTGGTNNYAFFSGLAAATGRWNLYMSGTAGNYLAGNLSVGTTTNAERLTVGGSTPFILINNNDETSSGIRFADTQNIGERFQAVFNSGDASFRLDRVESDGSIVERMRITSTGNVNVGSATDVLASSGLSTIFKIISSNNAGILLQNHFNDATGGSLYFTKTRSGIAGNYTSGVLSNDVMMFLAGEGSDGVSALRRAGTIAITADGNFSATSSPGRIVFGTTPTGSIAVSERMRITSAGNVGIGTTSPSTTLDVNGSITSSTNVRALRFWGGPSSFTTHSAPLHIFSSTIGADPIARFNNTESTDASTLTSMWLENYAGYRAEIAYTTHLNGSNIYINNTYNSGNILFSINSSEKARILNTGQFKLNGYTSTSSFTGTAAGYLAFDSSGNILTTAAPSGGISGSGTTNYVPKFTGSSAIGNSLIFDDGTNVGIGTSSPTSKLQVEGIVGINSGNNFVNTSTWEKWKLITTGVTAPARQGSDANGLNFTTNALWAPGWVQDDTTKKSFAYIQHLGNGRHEFRTSASGGTISWITALYINESLASFNVNVGIGTSTPSNKLQVYGGALTIADESTYSARFSNNSTKGVIIGYDTTNNKGHIGSINPLVAWTDLILNANGGNVGIGVSSPLMKLDLYGTSGLPATSGTTPTGSLRLHASNNAVLDFGVDNGTANGWIQSTDQGSLGAYYGLLLNPRGGNVGIGTTSPTSKLSVWQGEITISNLDASYTVPMGSVGAYNADATNGGLIFKTSLSGTLAEKVRIQNNGYVGIGTTTPAVLLDINSSTTNDRLVLSHTGSPKCVFGVTSAGANFLYHHTTGTFPMYISATGNFGIGTATPAAKLSVAGDINLLSTGAGIGCSTESVYFGGTTNGNYLSFGTNNTERARIANDGRFQVNNTGYSANCTATLRALTGTSTDKILECMTISYSSAFYVRNDGNYYFSGSNLSDARTKKDINYLEESILDKVMKLKPASFRYKENQENIKGGFIAQDIKEIFPDLVTATKSDDEMMGVDYYGVIAILTKAIQEQQVQIEELKAKLK